MSYSYNLAGQVSSVTSFGNTISYTRDITGRLTSVSGSPFGGVTQYVSNIKYRAWGGRRELTYGNNHTGSTQYNNRLLPTSYSLSNSMSRSYSYFPDGRLKISGFEEDYRLNRMYEYDHAGRLKSDTTPNSFAQNLTYDVWGNVTESMGWHWSQFIGANGTYSNNRNTNWQYNAAGQVTNNQDHLFQYDAAGRNSHVWTQLGLNMSDTGEILYDGDGQVIRSSGSGFYNLRSTVLGGRVIAEISNTGQRFRGFVYAEGEEVLATQNADNRVLWEHHDPAGLSFRIAEDSGIVVDEREETASGAKIEKEDPYPFNPDFTGADTDGDYPHIGSIGQPMTGCIRDGVRIPDCTSMLGDMSSFDNFYMRLKSESYYYRFVYRGSLTIFSGDMGPGGEITGDVLRGHTDLIALYSVHQTALWNDQSSGQISSSRVNPTSQKKPLDTSQTERLLTGDCVHFLNSMLAELGKIVDPYSYNFLGIFRKANKGSLYTKRMTPEEIQRQRGAGGTYSIVGDPAFYIYISEHLAYETGDNGYTLIHELFHAAAGSGGGYTHTDMATAAYNAAQANPTLMKEVQRKGIKGPRAVTYTRDGYVEADDFYNASVFDNILRIGCPQPPK